MVVRIATWNVNSIKVRLPQLLDWLRADGPEIVLLQEIKCLDEAFPRMEIGDLGYNIVTHGQKTYNGVAILSKFPLEDVRRGLPGNEADPQARYIEAVVSLPHSALRVASVYVPNGMDTASEKFAYKLQFLDHLQAHLQSLLAYGEALVIGGDYNIAPEDRDVHDPILWEGSVLTHAEVRSRFRTLLNIGYVDSGRLGKSQATDYTWWDYRAGAFQKNNGLRIDHVLLSPQATDKYLSYEVKTSMRAAEKASDHTPISVAIEM